MVKDIKRTKFLKDNEKLHEDVKRVIEFYCYQLNVEYCQGMLEVVLPFLYMKHTDESDKNFFDLACVFAYFKRFVLSFIPNNLHTKFNGCQDGLPYLHCCLNMTDILMNYVDKEICYHLKRKGICIVMYATSWVTTLFSRVVELNLIYEVWEVFLFERDKFFIFYFAASLIRCLRNKILALTSMEEILKLLKEIKINDFASLAEIYQNAVQIRQ